MAPQSHARQWPSPVPCPRQRCRPAGPPNRPRQPTNTARKTTARRGHSRPPPAALAPVVVVAVGLRRLPLDACPTTTGSIRAPSPMPLARATATGPPQSPTPARSQPPGRRSRCPGTRHPSHCATRPSHGSSATSRRPADGAAEEAPAGGRRSTHGGAGSTHEGPGSRLPWSSAAAGR
jgi:hypothetical protein